MILTFYNEAAFAEDDLRVITTVPEPSTHFLLGATLSGIGIMRKRFKK